MMMMICSYESSESVASTISEDDFDACLLFRVAESEPAIQLSQLVRLAQLLHMRTSIIGIVCTDSMCALVNLEH